MNPQPEPKRWERRGSRLIAKTRIFDLNGVTFYHPERKVEREFVMVDSADWVNVLAVTPDEQLVLVRQFRYGTEDFSLEIPGGIMEAGEDPVVAGLRELREETGYDSKSARVLASVRPNPAMQSNRCHFILAEGATLDHPVEWDHDEEIAVETRPVEEVFAMARSGQITHSLIVAALMHFEGYWRSRPGA